MNGLVRRYFDRPVVTAVHRHLGHAEGTNTGELVCRAVAVHAGENFATADAAGMDRGGAFGSTLLGSRAPPFLR